MSHLNKFIALSAISFGLASAVSAQSTSGPASTGGPAAQSAGEARQQEFQHPMLERRSSTDLRPGETREPRIQRRGMQETRQDGDMQRHVLPGAADTEGPMVAPRNHGQHDPVPTRLGQPD